MYYSRNIQEAAEAAFAKSKIYYFDRYRDGRKMAEGAKLTTANSEEEALAIAKRLFADCPNDVLRRRGDNL